MEALHKKLAEKFGPMPKPERENGSVYRVHCVTFTIAKRLVDMGNAMPVDLEKALNHPESAPAIFYFRAKPKYRTLAAKALRNQVAAEIRAVRKGTR